jgi:SAM-dependent methyltransferase
MNVTTHAFDRLASQYDALAHGELFRLMRRRTHAIFERSFAPGSRVLEIGCGTGLDTAFLASRGVAVVACDPSEAMVGRTLSRLANERTSATVMPCGLENVGMFLEALGEHAPFDGIISNFGALNCVPSLVPLRVVASTALKPGGAMLLCLMGRTCATETIYFALTGRRELMRRRSVLGPVPVPVAGVPVPTYYHRTSDVTKALGPDFTLVRLTGIGVTIPPPYFEQRWRTLPAFVRAPLAVVDSTVASWPAFNRLGDHALLHLVKNGAAHG